MELGVIGPIVMENVSRSEKGKGFYFFKISARLQIFIKLDACCVNPSREIKMDQIKNLRSANVRDYVFMMFQMISIWN